MKIIALLLALIMLIPAALLGGNLILRETTGADIFSTVVYAVQLTEDVDESVVCPNAVTTEDMLSVQAKVNQSVADMITYSALEDKFNINLERQSGNMTNMIELSAKDVAALAQIIIMQEDLGQIKISEDMYIDVQIKEADFEAIDDHNTRIKAVMTLDVAPVKDAMRDFLNGTSSSQEAETKSAEASASQLIGLADMAIDVIPDVLYITSTIVLEHTDSFQYNVHSEALAINNLTSAHAETLFTTINLFFGIGTQEYVNVQIGTALADALIGNESERGLASSLKDLGATDYDFVTKGGTTYFVVVR